jgi:hypothetical protein
VGREGGASRDVDAFRGSAGLLRVGAREVMMGFVHSLVFGEVVVRLTWTVEVFGS